MKYRTKPRVVSAARWPNREQLHGVGRAEWEGFCLLHRLVILSGARRYARRYAQPVPEGWKGISVVPGCPWVVVYTGSDGRQVVRQISDEEFTAEFEPTEQARDGRRDALVVWAHQELAAADADYLRLNRADDGCQPWSDPILRVERERIAALVQESGLTYDQTFDPEHPDRTLRPPPQPTAFRVTAEVSGVLRVLLDRPGERLRAAEIHTGGGPSFKVWRVLWRLKEAGWADQHADEPGATESRLWWLTDTGLRLARERLARRSSRQTGTEA